MQDTAAVVRLRFVARCDLDGLSGLAGDSVRVTHHEIAFVFGAGLEIEDRAGETMGDSVVEVLTPTVNIFATNAEEGESLPPRRFTHGAKPNGNASVAIGVTLELRASWRRLAMKYQPGLHHPAIHNSL